MHVGAKANVLCLKALPKLLPWTLAPNVNLDARLKVSIKSTYCLGLIPWAPVASEPLEAVRMLVCCEYCTEFFIIGERCLGLLARQVWFWWSVVCRRLLWLYKVVAWFFCFLKMFYFFLACLLFVRSSILSKPVISTLEKLSSAMKVVPVYFLNFLKLLPTYCHPLSAMANFYLGWMILDNKTRE